MKTFYEVNEANKTIVVNMKRITDSQIKVIKNYLEFGYKLVEYKPTKNDSEEFTAKTIEKVLKNRTELQDLFKSICNEVVIDKETGETKLKKDGKPKTKGHIAGFKWYKENIAKGNNLKEMEENGTIKEYLDSLDIEEIKKGIAERRKAEEEKIKALKNSK